MAVGYIYILSHSDMGELLKIGFTCGSVEGRAKELAGVTGVPGDFVVEYFHISDDVEEVEGLIHQELAASRHNAKREFFNLSVVDAMNVVQRFLRQPATRFLLAPERFEPKGPKKECRRCGYSYFTSEEQRYCPKCEF